MLHEVQSECKQCKERAAKHSSDVPRGAIALGVACKVRGQPDWHVCACARAQLSTNSAMNRMCVRESRFHCVSCVWRACALACATIARAACTVPRAQQHVFLTPQSTIIRLTSHKCQIGQIACVAPVSDRAMFATHARVRFMNKGEKPTLKFSHCMR